MNQLDLSYYSKKDLPNILVYIELILTVGHSLNITKSAN